MTNVWLARCGAVNEGNYILGIFDSRLKARACIEDEILNDILDKFKIITNNDDCMEWFDRDGSGDCYYDLQEHKVL